MSEFVKKTMMGYREVPGGHSDPECTHAILTVKEYTELLRKISAAEQDARTAKYDADRDIAAAKRDASQKVYQASQEAQNQVEAIQQELEAERAECAHQRSLNANLLRISKERANAERGLKPKKERTGYIVVHSEEKEYSFRDGRKRLYKVKLWETIIQSPYSVEFAEDVVRKQIEDELFPKEKGWLIGRIGITGKYDGSYEKMRESMEQNPEKNFYQGNVVIARQQRLKRNFRSNYWEIAIVHTRPLGDIPEDLMLPSKKPVQET
jgi:vacuolar-type H+-ATPase subunit H